jgi:hypothetical protein
MAGRDDSISQGVCTSEKDWIEDMIANMIYSGQLQRMTGYLHHLETICTRMKKPKMRK